MVREFMDRRLFTRRDEAAIALVEQTVSDLKRAGAEVVDPGPEGSLFGACFRTYGPPAFGKLFTRRYPALFPVDAAGRPAADHLQRLADLAGRWATGLPGVAVTRVAGGEIPTLR